MCTEESLAHLLVLFALCFLIVLFSLNFYSFFFGYVWCRTFINTLQYEALDAFRNVLVLSPVSLEVLREEGLWDLIFSENIFYFGEISDELSGESCTISEMSTRMELKLKVISFIEFAATSTGSVHNSVGFCFLISFLMSFLSQKLSFAFEHRLYIISF